MRDAAQAVLAAMSHDRPGIFNIVDDEPAEVQTWLPELAKVVGTPGPKHVPAALARLFVEAWGVAYMTKLRGASNARAQDVLCWKPRYTSWGAPGVQARVRRVGPARATHGQFRNNRSFSNVQIGLCQLPTPDQNVILKHGGVAEWFKAAVLKTLPSHFCNLLQRDGNPASSLLPTEER